MDAYTGSVYTKTAAKRLMEANALAWWTVVERV